jgi:hypothetical protein
MKHYNLLQMCKNLRDTSGDLNEDKHQLTLYFVNELIKDNKTDIPTAYFEGIRDLLIALDS